MHEIFFHHGQKYAYGLTTNNGTFWISLVSALITFLAIIVALFKDWILSHVLKPKLSFKTSPSIQQLDAGVHYTMYRLLVTNDGSSAARNVRALISNVSQPLYLKWTTIDDINRDISKKEPAYLDVIQEKHGTFYFYPWGHIINSPDYKISNTDPTSIKIDFYEKNNALQSATLRLDPIAKTLEVV